MNTLACVVVNSMENIVKCIRFCVYAQCDDAKMSWILTINNVYIDMKHVHENRVHMQHTSHFRFGIFLLYTVNARTHTHGLPNLILIC